MAVKEDSEETNFSFSSLDDDDVLDEIFDEVGGESNTGRGGGNDVVVDGDDNDLVACLTRWADVDCIMIMTRRQKEMTHVKGEQQEEDKMLLLLLVLVDDILGLFLSSNKASRS